jgi:hypothetical protein
MIERWPDPAEPLTTLRLRLDEPPPEGEDPITHDISAVAVQGDTLFLSADECAHVEVLHRLPDGSYGDHDRIDLAKIFELPDEHDEMDVEGLAVDDGWLWVVGSHSRTRRKPKKGKPLDDDAEAKLAELKDNLNRFFLGRVPLARRTDGGERYGVAGLDAPKVKGRRPGMLAIKAKGNPIAKQLRKDPHLAPFLDIPAKENGVDIEGIAALGTKIAVGLRGPVINGWACVLEFDVREGKGGALKLEGEYVKRWFELDGLGIRDMKRDGDDVLILAGPTMSLDGPSPVYRWRNWAEEPAKLVKPERVLCLPFGYQCEHAEAITPWPTNEGPGLLIVNDSPARSRLSEGAIDADVFRL